MFPLVHRLIRDCRGNVAVIFALAMLPLCFLIGMAIDYTMASDRQAQLNGFADAAALSAVTPAMMAQNDAAAQTTAVNTFNAQATQLQHVVYSPNDLNISVTTNANGTRTAVVSYAAQSPNFFATLLGKPDIDLSGSSTATGGLPPNINFYLLLDDSPSMAIAATSAGMQTMINNTQYECDSPPAGGATCGCAFGCHESHPAGETHCNGSSCGISGSGNPGGEDNYALAKSLGVTLRMDLVTNAAQSLMSNAQNTENSTTAAYQMAVYSFDRSFNTIQTLTSTLTGANSAQSAAGNVKLLEVYDNNNLTSSTYNADTDTNFDNAFNNVNTIMPDPGSGTNASGDTPQEVLFLVTDGAEDENVSKVSGACPSVSSGDGSDIAWSGGGKSGCRQQSVINTPTDWCTTIKNRGIRIAVLYTAYNPISNNGWYNSYWNNIQPTIEPTLEACASPGLYHKVQTNDDISAALNDLFDIAVQSAYLAK